MKNIIIIAIIILLSTLLVGTPVNKSNIQIVYIALSVLGIIYSIFKIIKKEKMQITKLDICISLLAFSGLIPLIFKTYVSLSGTIYSIIKFFAIFIAYVIIKNECKKNPKNIDVIINLIIISIIILCIIGIDEINGNYLEDFKKVIKYDYIEYDEIRICSLFSYPNTMAAVAGLGFFLCLGYIFKKIKIRYKILYVIASILMLITLVLTYSRLVYIIFAITCFIYFIILCKKYNIKEKISKNIIVFGIVILLVLIIYIVMGLQISEQIEIEETYQKILYSIDQNKDYTFSFNIEAISNKEDNFIIKITEKDEYFDDLNVTELRFGSYVGNKEIKIHTTDTTAVIYINIEKVNVEDNSTLGIKNSFINGKELILNYKLLPTKVVEKIESISFNNKSVWERFSFITDAMKAIKENWIFGLGGDAWKTIQYKYQEYNYFALEAHSFPIQMFLENGIIALIAILGIIIMILKFLIKEIRKAEIDTVNISIVISVIFILLHSFLDFDMSYFYVLLIVTILIAIISSKKEQYEIKLNRIIYMVLIILSLCVLYVSSIEMYFKNDIEGLKVSLEWTEERIYNTYDKLIPFNQELQRKRYLIITRTQKYSEIQELIEDYISTEKYDTINISLDSTIIYIDAVVKSNDNVNEKLEYILEYVKNTSEFSKYEPKMQFTRLNNINRIINILEEYDNQYYADKFKNQLINEIEEKEKYILDYRKSRYEKEYVDEYKQELVKIKEGK